MIEAFFFIGMVFSIISNSGRSGEIACKKMFGLKTTQHSFFYLNYLEEKAFLRNCISYLKTLSGSGVIEDQIIDWIKRYIANF